MSAQHLLLRQHTASWGHLRIDPGDVWGAGLQALEEGLKEFGGRMGLAKGGQVECTAAIIFATMQLLIFI